MQLRVSSSIKAISIVPCRVQASCEDTSGPSAGLSCGVLKLGSNQRPGAVQDVTGLPV